MYLLIHEGGEHQTAIEADLRAEVEVQLGVQAPIGEVSDLLREPVGLKLDDTNPIRILRIEHWSKELVGLLDTHVIRLERSRAQFLFFRSIWNPCTRSCHKEVMVVIRDSQDFVSYESAALQKSCRGFASPSAVADNSFGTSGSRGRISA